MHRVTAVVVVPACTPFPMDMLRYDQCWPTQESQTRQLGELVNTERKITVCRRTEFRRGASFAEKWTVGRWESFGVRIQEES